MANNERPTGSEFGATLRRLRKERGLTQRELSYLASLNSSHVPLIELGYVHPNQDTTERLAEALEQNPAEFWAHAQESRINWRKVKPRDASKENPQDSNTFAEKAYFPLEVSEWIRSVARRRGVSISEVIAGHVCPAVYREIHASHQRQARMSGSFNGGGLS